MATPRRCIICLNYLKSKKKLIPRHSLEEQTVIMYFLRKLAWTPVPEEDVEKFLKRGNPSEWASFCYICEEQVKRCLDMHLEIGRIIGQITEIRRKLYEENFYESEGEEDEEEFGSGSCAGGAMGVFKQLREQLFSDFKEGGGEEAGRFKESIEITYKTADDMEEEEEGRPNQTIFVTTAVKEEVMMEMEDEGEESRDYNSDAFSNDFLEDNNEEGSMLLSSAAGVNDNAGLSSSQMEGELKQHLPDKTARECPSCGKGFSSFPVLKRHFKESHLKVKDLPCSICFKSFSRKEYLAAHIDLKHPEKLDEFDNIGYRPTKQHQCPHCPRKFSVGRALQMHISSKHRVEGSERYCCDQCDMSYKKKDSLAFHKRRVHSGLKRESGATSSTVGEEQDRTIPCSQCSRMFRSRQTMERHVRETHDKVKDFVCPHCGKASSRKRDMDRHIYTIHGEGNVRVKVRCSICRKMCGSQRALVSHKRLAHGVKEEVKCDLCGRSYANEEALAIHKASMHVGEGEKETAEFEESQSHVPTTPTQDPLSLPQMEVEEGSQSQLQGQQEGELVAGIGVDRV